MRWLLSLVLVLVAVGMLRVVGCGGDEPIPCDPELLGADCPKAQCNAAECPPELEVCVYGEANEGTLCLSGVERGLCSSGECSELRRIPCESSGDCPRAPERHCGYIHCGDDEYCEYIPRPNGCIASDGSIGKCLDGVCTLYSGEIECVDNRIGAPCRRADGRDGTCKYGLCGGPEFCEGVVCDQGDDLCERAFCNHAGECEYRPPRECRPPSICQTSDCDPATGECVNTPVPDGPYGEAFCCNGEYCARRTCETFESCSPQGASPPWCLYAPVPDGPYEDAFCCNGEQCNPPGNCETLSCSPTGCVYMPAPDGQSCVSPRRCESSTTVCILYSCWEVCSVYSGGEPGVCIQGKCFD